MAERFVWFKLQLMVLSLNLCRMTSGKQHLVSELLFAIAKMGEMFLNHKMINTKVFPEWFCDRHGNASCVPTSGCFSERGKKKEKREIVDPRVALLQFFYLLEASMVDTLATSQMCIYVSVWPLTPSQSSTDSVKSPALMTWELTEMFWLEWN